MAEDNPGLTEKIIVKEAPVHSLGKIAVFHAWRG